LLTVLIEDFEEEAYALKPARPMLRQVYLGYTAAGLISLAPENWVRRNERQQIETERSFLSSDLHLSTSARKVGH
jgi:hypothetical protein